MDREENLEKSLQILFAYLIWGKRFLKKKQSNFEVFGIRFQTCALVKARSEQECWVVVLMIRVRQAVCLLWMNSTTNKQTAHCVMTQAVLSSANNMGYKSYETGRIWLSNLSQDECFEP